MTPSRVYLSLTLLHSLRMTSPPDRFRRSRAARERREAQAKRDNLFIYILFGACILVVAGLVWLSTISFS